MKAFLMYPDQDFYLGQKLPPNETDLAADLELGVVPRAMADGDKFLFDVSRLGLQAGLTSTEEIVYRQHVLADCIAQPAVVRDLYDVAIEAIAGEKKLPGWVFRDSPESIVHRSRQLLELYVAVFRRLRGIADTHAASFRSEGFTRFFAMLSKELGDDYLAEIEAHIGELAFRRGTLISAALGKGNKGTGYTVRRQPEQSRRDRIPGINRNGYSFYIAERDDAGMRTLSDLASRGLNGAANALAQATDHIRSFFGMLRAELGFYLGGLNLRDRLLARGHPVCFPGSEIARQIIRALTEAGIRIIFVTHMFDLAGRYYAAHDPAALFLRAERRPDGQRTFRVPPGEPLPTSYGEDLYQQVFGIADTEARV
jgi:hypothetical protein